MAAAGDLRPQSSMLGGIILLLFPTYAVSHCEQIFTIATHRQARSAMPRRLQNFLVLFSMMILSVSSYAFSLQRSSSCRPPAVESQQRRQLFAFVLPACAVVLAPSSPAQAAVMSDTQKVFKAGEALGIPQSKKRFQEASKTLDYLLEHYEDIVSNGGGDNVRRYLGTVGTTSALYGIPKVLKELQSESSDIVEYTENMNDFGYYLSAADTSLYSANFIEFSASKGTPQQYFEAAKKELVLTRACMDRMAAELEL
jgi:hypothetical protein